MRGHTAGQRIGKENVLLSAPAITLKPPSMSALVHAPRGHGSGNGRFFSRACGRNVNGMSIRSPRASAASTSSVAAAVPTAARCLKQATAGQQVHGDLRQIRNGGGGQYV
jgi:hypothetical protein